MQLHSLLSDYLDRIEVVVTELPAYAEKYVEEIVTSERINLRLRLRFDNGNLLEVNEAIVVDHEQLSTLGYRYHFQNAGNRLLFRYDDTPHFPELDTFPHHKHTETYVVRHDKPVLVEVLKEAVSYGAEEP